MKNFGIYFNSLIIGATSAWIATAVLNGRSPQPAETLIETSEVVQDVATIEDTTERLDELVVRPGDAFWGLQLDGILPCSKMLVRGGGHIVNFSLLDDAFRRSHFHVRKEKAVSVYDRKFTITIVSDDEIRVRRTPEETVVAVVGN